MRLLVASVFFLLISVAAANAQERRDIRGEPYTYLEDGAQASWPRGTRRLALLIGNTAYDRVGVDSQRPSASPLARLPAACPDVRAVAQKLADIGWRRDEIVVLCNQTKGQIEAALSLVRSNSPSDPDRSRLLYIYLAGHGMSVNGRTYFFGVNARPDLDEAADDLVYGDAKRRLFLEDAVDIGETFRSGYGLRVQFPIVLVLDACRDNPMYGALHAKYWERYDRREARRTKTEERGLPEVAISAATLASVAPPGGMQIIYATERGTTIPDSGPRGNSYLAVAWMVQLREEKAISEVVSAVIDTVIASTENVPGGRGPQVPDTHGQPRGGWCLYGCDLPGRLDKEAEVASRPVSVPALERAALRKRSQPADSVPSAPAEAPDISPPSAFNVEIFWCETSKDPDQQRRLARSLEIDLLKRRRSGFIGARGETLGTIRVTPLSRDDNESPIYRHNGYEAVVDPGDGEFSLAVDLIGKRSIFVRTANRAPTPQYVSFFFCSGARTVPPAAKVYVQVPGYEDLYLGSRIVDRLTFANPDLNVLPEVERVANKSPSVTQVRYYSTKRREEADVVARQLRDLLKSPVESRYLEELAKPGTADTIEVWLGRSDVAAAPK